MAETHIVKTKKSRGKPGPFKRVKPEEALAVATSWEQGYQIPERIREICTMFLQQELINAKFKKSSLPWIEQYTLRIGILLAGLVEKEMITQGALDSIKKASDVLPAMRAAFGFTNYAVILDKKKDRKRLMALANQQAVWSGLSEFRYQLMIPPGAHAFERYVDGYRQEVRNMKYRIRLAEIIDVNISTSDRFRYIKIVKEKDKSKQGDDAPPIERLEFRSIFSYLFMLSAFRDHEGPKLITDFIDLKALCTDDFGLVYDRFKKLLEEFIQPVEMAQGIFALPELQSFLDKVKTNARSRSLRTFMAFFDSDHDALNLAKALSRAIVDIGEWSWRRKQQELTDEQTDFVSPSLSRVSNKEFTRFLGLYPWFAKFLSRTEIMRYMVSETHESRKERVTPAFNQERLSQAQEFLKSAMSVSEMLGLFLGGTTGGEQGKELASIIGEILKPVPESVSKEKYSRRARLYVNKLLTEWSDRAIINAITDRELPVYVSELFPRSYKVYLWYLHNTGFANDKTWDLPFEFDSSILEYVQKGDIERYLKHKASSIKVRAAKKDVELGIQQTKE